jgi:cryptochrome
MFIVRGLELIDGSFCRSYTLYNALKFYILTNRNSIDSLNDVSTSITKLNKNSKLHLLREAPQTLFPKLFKAWRITHLVFEKDTDAYARDRDAVVMKAAKEAGVKVIIKHGRTLWESDELVKRNGGNATMTITQVQTAGPKVGPIPRPIPSPNSLPDPGELALNFEQEQPDSKPDFNSGPRKQDDKSYEKVSGPNGDFAVPSLEELGMLPATTKHRGGESLALIALDKIIANAKYTATFEKPKTAPTDFEPQATTLLSPHLHFGSLSIREFYWRVQDTLTSYPGKASEPPVSLLGQLYFRDMYFGAQAAGGYYYAQTINNPHCRFIPFSLPAEIDPESKLITGNYQATNPQAEEWFFRWKYGLTGFPFIDALMRQLRLEGWIHHLGRHSVACFLTRGGCFIHWERGAEVFEEWLIDHEVASNVGNWQWLSCTAFYSMYYRVYSPIAFGQKWDPEGKYVRKLVPELKDLDKKYIYEPWKAPKTELKKAGVSFLTQDQTMDRVQRYKEGLQEVATEDSRQYPRPIFDFAERRKYCLDKMKEAYHVNLYGNDPKVLDGSWKELFADTKVGEADEKKATGDDNEAGETGDGNAGGNGKRKRGREKGQGTLDGMVKREKKLSG